MDCPSTEIEFKATLPSRGVIGVLGFASNDTDEVCSAYAFGKSLINHANHEVVYFRGVNSLEMHVFAGLAEERHDKEPTLIVLVNDDKDRVRLPEWVAMNITMSADCVIDEIERAKRIDGIEDVDGSLALALRIVRRCDVIYLLDGGIKNKAVEERIAAECLTRGTVLRTVLV